MAYPRIPSRPAGLDCDEVEPKRQARHGRAVGKRAHIHQPVRPSPKAAALAVVDGLLRETEIAACAPTDLDDHQLAGRTRVDRHEIEFEAADMDIPGQDGPAESDDAFQDQRFGGITRLLGRGPRRSGGRAIQAPDLGVEPSP